MFIERRAVSQGLARRASDKGLNGYYEKHNEWGQTGCNRMANLRVLVIYTAQSARVKQELVKSSAVHPVRICRNRGLFGQDDFSRDRRIDGKQAPVHESTISKVRVVNLLGRPFQNFVYERFHCI